MKRVVFFPYHTDISIVIENRHALRDWEICGFMSFKEDEALLISLSQALGMTRLPDDQLLKDCDAVILLDNYRDFRTDKYYQVIDAALSHQKEIFVTPLARTQLNLEHYQDKYQLLEFLPDGMDAIDKECVSRQGATDNKLYPIEIPVIGVFGQGKNCDKFENQLLLKQVLGQDYETAIVSSNALGVLFGCYSMPPFLYETIPFQEKIFKFNYYIRKISKTGNPDAIVIGVPEGIVPFRRQEFHHFAEYPLIISSAVDFDLAILCTYFLWGDKLEGGLKMLIDFCQNKFAVPIGAVSISRIAVEVPGEETQKIIWEPLNAQYLHKYYPEVSHVNFPTINLTNRETAMATMGRCLEQLQGNVGAI